MREGVRRAKMFGGITSFVFVVLNPPNPNNPRLKKAVKHHEPLIERIELIG